MAIKRGDVIAVRGSLQMVADGSVEPNDMSSMCRIRDPNAGTVSDPIPVQVALKWGYWTDPPRQTGSKAGKGPATGGRWRTLADGRRVMVTGARRGAMGATWTGKRYLGEGKGAPSSISPDYLLTKSGGKEHIEAHDVMGYRYIMAAAREDLDHDNINYNEELSRVGHTKQFVEEMLTDPANHDFFAYIDDAGVAMMEVAGRDLGTQEGVFRGVGANIIFTHNTDDVGAGSGGTGSMRVFYAPYQARPRATQEYMRGGLGVDPLFVTVHELHHALGSHTELDVFSDVMAIATHYSLGNELAPKNVNYTMFGMFTAARSRAVPSKDCPTWPHYVRRQRAGLRWLYDNFPKQFKDSYDANWGGGWEGMERRIKGWKASYD